MNELLGSLLRKALVFVGSWLIAKGWVTDAQWADILTALVGLLLTIVPVVWSAIRRWLFARAKTAAASGKTAMIELPVQKAPRE